MKNQVLNHNKIIRICNRLAYQIVENSESNNTILIIGVKEKGLEISKLIVDKLKKICSNKVVLKSIQIDKNDPQNMINCDLSISKIYKKVFIVDDVLNTGKTLMYVIKKLLEYREKMNTLTRMSKPLISDERMEVLIDEQLRIQKLVNKINNAFDKEKVKLPNIN